jgi:hypothetical protein
VEGYGSFRVAEWINNQGIRTHNGCKWQCNTVLRILRNPIYTGYFITKTAQSGFKPEIKIIEPEMFNQAAVILGERAKVFEEKQSRIIPLRTSVNILSGKLYCADCHTRLSTTSSIDRYICKDGSVSEKKSRRYVCYHNTRSLTQCNGQTSYAAEKVENLVIEMLKEVFNTIRTIPQEKAIEVRYLKQIALQRDILKKQEAQIDALSKELKVLKDEVVNTLTGKGKFSVELLSGILTEKEQELQAAVVKRDALANGLDDKQSVLKSFDGQYSQFVSWADEFENCSFEKAQMIISYLVDRIEIDRGYKIKVYLNTVYEQFMITAA